ncbi:glutamate ABC transporter substrate-binding protein [Prescottella agglutinans]|uniref:Glutamate ABC transporter substrate-binding protein n=1 Tax=Prescottella agglutinans TaxID=1644129 RepID=A0A3S3CZ08_9NOCA|nr:glutamate ABC transporter substrate-binding protein [Prescottella agglutinans]RVW09105.1 glutamate ABC transporter substrate-binding protein [Prescottella agglutinans]
MLACAAAASVLTACAAVHTPPVAPAGNYTDFPLPSGAKVLPPATTTVPGVAECDATASLRPPPPGDVAPGPKVSEILARGRVIVGVDQRNYLFSARDPVTGALAGFDVDIAHEIARDLFGDPAKVEFKLVNPADRIQAVQDSTVDMFIMSTTMTCARAEQIAFSAEYFQASQRLLVPQTSGVREPADLAGKRVCSLADTPAMYAVQRLVPDVRIVTVTDWDDCLVALQQGQADAVSTDDSILLGMAVQDPNLRMVGPAMEIAPYGIGINKNDDDLVRAVNGSLERIGRDGTWTDIYNRWLAPLGPSPGLPAPHYRD